MGGVAPSRPSPSTSRNLESRFWKETAPTCSPHRGGKAGGGSACCGFGRVLEGVAPIECVRARGNASGNLAAGQLPRIDAGRGAV